MTNHSRFRKLPSALVISAISLATIPALTISAAPARAAQVAIGISVGIEPPPLPVYEQPPCPGEDYIWTPGYWAWDGSDYYWVPGTWVLAPESDYLWTPGYWAWGNGGYVWIPGYWGPVVGFYGGIDYGFGYVGHGYYGGRWDRGHFFYNSAVNNVNVTIVRNTYVDRSVVVNDRNENRASFNGGNGGVEAHPTAQDQAATRQRHVAPIAAQAQQASEARSNRQLHAAVNHGAPPIAATQKAGAFSGNGVVRAQNQGNFTRTAGRLENNPSGRTQTDAARPNITPNNSPNNAPNNRPNNLNNNDGRTNPTRTNNAPPEPIPHNPAATPPTFPNHPRAGGESNGQPQPSRNVQPNNTPRPATVPNNTQPNYMRPNETPRQNNVPARHQGQPNEPSHFDQPAQPQYAQPRPAPQQRPETQQRAQPPEQHAQPAPQPHAQPQQPEEKRHDDH